MLVEDFQNQNVSLSKALLVLGTVTILGNKFLKRSRFAEALPSNWAGYGCRSLMLISVWEEEILQGYDHRVKSTSKHSVGFFARVSGFSNDGVCLHLGLASVPLRSCSKCKD
jgi:hypothetical protein